ncbi:MAG: hypothetical protein NVSMB31_11600 [Vulcanimicrobiaceae bacterium]
MKSYTSPSQPRCYILDEEYKVKLAMRGRPEDPLNGFYTSNCAPDSLPDSIEAVVRRLTAGWNQVAEDAAAVVGVLSISVTPLHGPAGRHIGVFVRSTA